MWKFKQMGQAHMWKELVERSEWEVKDLKFPVLWRLREVVCANSASFTINDSWPNVDGMSHNLDAIGGGVRDSDILTVHITETATMTSGNYSNYVYVC
jgi:hypothetical protein